jgi:hypothetical protein
MPDETTAAPITPTYSIDDHQGAPLRVGDPDVHGPLAVFPLFGPEPKLDYTSFARAHGAEQVAITELEGGASVNDLMIHNTGSKPVLLYEGEELLGAQQNRVLDVSLLIAAEAKTRIPVSCVEAGRWDGSRRSERFRPSRQAADPELRKLKQRRVRERVAAGAPARPDQGEVWDEVGGRMAAFGASSPTAAMSDVYENRRDQLAELREAVTLHDGQCGAICAIAGKISILDCVSRPAVWADLHPALLEGYALDALRLAGASQVAPEPPGLGTVRGFTLLVGDAPTSDRRREAGLGATARFAGGGVAGSALVAAPTAPGTDAGEREEVVQLVAYPEGPEHGPGNGPPAGRVGRSRSRIRRPSSRRGR